MADNTIWRPWHLMEQTRYGDRSQWTEIEVWDDGNDVIVATEVRRAHNDGGRKRMELIAAAGTAASELPERFDPIAAARANAKLIDALEYAFGTERVQQIIRAAGKEGDDGR